MSTPLMRRIEALEAETEAFLARRAPTPINAAERAERTYQIVRMLARDETFRHVASKPHDGYWPYVPGPHGGPKLLRYEALKAMADASDDRMLTMLHDAAAQLNVPHDGGEVLLYASRTDIDPLVRLWFEPVDGADLV